MRWTFAASAAVVACLAFIPGFSSDDGAALGQSNPCFNPGSGCRALETGDVPTAAQWNAFFAAKQDAVGSGAANLFLATPNGSAGAPLLRSIVPRDLPAQVVTTIGASQTIAAAGIYAVTTVGVTITLPSSSTVQGSVVIKDMTGSTSPNITIAGNVDGSSAGASIVNPHEALLFSPAPTLSTWIVQ